MIPLEPAATGDGAGILIQMPDAFLRKVGWYFHGERCDDAVPPLDAAPRRTLDDEDESFDALG